MARPFLYFLSFYTNAAILVFEITGGRLLAPYVGTSVQVWAALIAVVLGGMALGYHYGGRFADANSSRERIGIVVFASGAAALLSWSMRDIVGTWVGSGVSYDLGALVAGIILFFPTVALLAAVSPMLAKNLVGDLSKTGTTVGELTATGTAGSIFGALVSGLYLIPSFGVGAILLSVAVSLLVLGLCLLGGKMLKFLGIAAACAVVAFFISGIPTYATGTVADISTAYNRIFITDGEGKDGQTYRALFTSPDGIQCITHINENGAPDTAELVADYQKAHAAATAFFMPHGPSRALFIGGCALTFPMFLSLSYPDMLSTVVEIDTGMTEAARDYFGFSDATFPHMAFAYEDARKFMNVNREKYDIEFFDAFNSSGRVPFQLVTKEAFAGMADALTDDGIFIMNSYGSYGGEGALFPSVFVKTAETAFRYVGFYQYGGKPEDNQNVVIIASKTKPLPDTISAPAFPGVVLTKVPAQKNVITLSDDYAPVEGIFRTALRE